MICTFYDHPIIRKLYPTDAWKYEVVNGNKNSNQGGNQDTEELILTKKRLSRDQISRYLQKITPQMELFAK